ncbi:MAG: DNA recombination protein RmuC [Bacteroidales bacterium]|nr:DNA recombination protein RmuC [Bacteroidales bacterium]
MVYIISGSALLLGAAVAWLYARSRSVTASRELEKELDVNREKLAMAGSSLGSAEKNLEEERNKVSELSRKLAIAGEKERSMQEKYEHYQKEVDKLQEKFKLEFENIASKILKQNTLDFSVSNQKSINEVINPLRQKIEEFEKTVSETYQKGLKDQVDLKAEIKNLHELNTRLSEEANNLTRALKSDSKKQGNWGEMVLERLLERSGLTKGEEYLVQESYRNDKGEMIRPDVIIRLPENKHIIIDSKVSLKAYEAFIGAETEEQKTKFVKAHVESVREHVKELAGKSYQLTEKLDTPDFVLLFMPLESAFSLAIQEQSDLFSFAWERKIVIVSPTTLLATLMTVGSIWKHEKQTRNALEIARQGGRLYDKFVSFLGDLENLGRQIDRVQATYHEAHKKLGSGAGNIIGKVKILQELGAKTSKEIPQDYLETNSDDDEEES